MDVRRVCNVLLGTRFHKPMPSLSHLPLVESCCEPSVDARLW